MTDDLVASISYSPSKLVLDLFDLGFSSAKLSVNDASDLRTGNPIPGWRIVRGSSSESSL